MICQNGLMQIKNYFKHEYNFLLSLFNLFYIHAFNYILIKIKLILISYERLNILDIL